MTDSIEIRPIRVGDAEEIFRLIVSCRDYLAEWLPWADYTRNVRDTKDYIEANVGKDIFSGREIFTVKYYGAIVGLIDLHGGDHLNRKAEIGYWLHEKFQGRGIMTAACKICLDYAFNQLDLNRIVIKCVKENLKSRNIPERLSFSYEGLERAGFFLKDVFRDLAVYSMLHKEWLKLYS